MGKTVQAGHCQAQITLRPEASDLPLSSAVLLLESKSCVSLKLILPQQACQAFRPLEGVTTQAP